MTEPREALNIRYEDDTLFARVLPKEAGGTASDNLDKLKIEDPFSDSDLPIEISQKKE